MSRYISKIYKSKFAKTIYNLERRGVVRSFTRLRKKIQANKITFWLTKTMLGVNKLVN